MKRNSFLLGALLTVFPFHFSAQAQSLGDGKEGWDFSIGAGLIIAPSYVGDDSYQILAVPDIRVRYKDKFFASVQEGVGYNVIHDEHWRVGPLVRYDFGRDEDGDSPFRIGGHKTDDLIGLGDVDGTAEVGAFVEYKLTPVTARLEVMHGAGGHEGMLGKGTLAYSGRMNLINAPVTYSFGPEVKFADSKYHEAYFGIDAGQSASSGLQQYDTDAGILSYGVNASVIVPVTDTLSSVFFANYSVLGNEAADSPLVEQRGSEGQSSAGLFVNYRF